MKFNFDLMDAVIKDLESRGAVVMVMVEVNPKEVHKNVKVRGDWSIDAKWSSGRHWIIADIKSGR